MGTLEEVVEKARAKAAIEAEDLEAAVEADPENGVKTLAKELGVDVADLPIEKMNVVKGPESGKPVSGKKDDKVAKRTAERLAKKNAEPKTLGLCHCGCGETCVRPGAKFRMGHDARLNGICIKVATGKLAATAIPEIAKGTVLKQLDCGHWVMDGYHGQKECACKRPAKVKTERKPGELTGAAKKAHEAKLAKEAEAKEAPAK